MSSGEESFSDEEEEEAFPAGKPQSRQKGDTTEEDASPSKPKTPTKEESTDEEASATEGESAEEEETTPKNEPVPQDKPDGDTSPDKREDTPPKAPSQTDGTSPNEPAPVVETKPLPADEKPPKRISPSEETTAKASPKEEVASKSAEQMFDKKPVKTLSRPVSKQGSKQGSKPSSKQGSRPASETRLGATKGKSGERPPSRHLTPAKSRQRGRSWSKIDPFSTETDYATAANHDAQWMHSEYDRPMFSKAVRITESELYRKFDILDSATKKKKRHGSSANPRPVWFMYLNAEEREAFKKIYKHVSSTLAKDINLKILIDSLIVIDPDLTPEDVMKFYSSCSLDVNNKINFADLLFSCAGVEHAFLQQVVARGSIVPDVKEKKEFYLKSFSEKQRKYLTAIGFYLTSKNTSDINKFFDKSASEKPHVIVDIIQGEHSRLVRNEAQFKQLHTQLLLESLADATNSPYAIPLTFVADDRQGTGEASIKKARLRKAIREAKKLEKKQKEQERIKKLNMRVVSNIKQERCYLSMKGLQSKGYINQREEFHQSVNEAYNDIKKFRLKVAQRATTEIQFEGMSRTAKKRFKELTIPAYLPTHLNDIFVVNPWDPKNIPNTMLSGKRSNLRSQRLAKPFS